jgi:hypothetical protein
MQRRAIAVCLLVLALVAAANGKKVCNTSKPLEGVRIDSSPIKVYNEPDRRASLSGCRTACKKNSRCLGWTLEGHPRTPAKCSLYGTNIGDYYVGNSMNGSYSTNFCQYI